MPERRRRLRQVQAGRTIPARRSRRSSPGQPQPQLHVLCLSRQPRRWGARHRAGRLPIPPEALGRPSHVRLFPATRQSIRSRQRRTRRHSSPAASPFRRSPSLHDVPGTESVSNDAWRLDVRDRAEVHRARVRPERRPPRSAVSVNPCSPPPEEGSAGDRSANFLRPDLPREIHPVAADVRFTSSSGTTQFPPASLNARSRSAP